MIGLLLAILAAFRPEFSVSHISAHTPNRQVLYGAITPEVPASILQLHNDVTIVADEAALSEIDK